MAMGAKECFARRDIMAGEISQQIKNEHAVRANTASKPTARRFKGGAPVWVLRPQPNGTHRCKTSFTHEHVFRRIGEDTYRVEVGLGPFTEQHEGQLRAREHSICWKHVSLDYTAHEAVTDDDYAELDSYTVEKILAPPLKASATVGVEFQVCWRGSGPSHDT